MEKKEYIERGAALLAITGQPTELHYPSWYKGNIMEVPAADVVEVVRCGECKYRDQASLCCTHYTRRETLVVCTRIGYCSYGERKEE